MRIVNTRLQYRDYAEEDRPVETRERLRFQIVIWLMSLAGVAALVLALATGAKAHEAPLGWSYPLECCHNRDCAEIPSDRVKEGPGGYRVTLLPGDHDFVTAPVSHLIPYGIAKPSPDGLYHICLLPNGAFICFFAGARNF